MRSDPNPTIYQTCLYNFVHFWVHLHLVMVFRPRLRQVDLLPINTSLLPTQSSPSPTPLHFPLFSTTHFSPPSSGSEEDEELTCFALSPDDKLLVSASRGLLMVQWDPESGSPARTWKAAHQLPVEVMTFDSTSTLLASGGADGTVKIYDMVRE